MNAQHQFGDEQRLAALKEALWTLAYKCRALYNDNLGLYPAMVLEYLQCLGTGSVDGGAADVGGQSQNRVEVSHEAIHELATEVAALQLFFEDIRLRQKYPFLDEFGVHFLIEVEKMQAAWVIGASVEITNNFSGLLGLSVVSTSLVVFKEFEEKGAVLMKYSLIPLNTHERKEFKWVTQAEFESMEDIEYNDRRTISQLPGPKLGPDPRKSKSRLRCLTCAFKSSSRWRSGANPNKNMCQNKQCGKLREYNENGGRKAENYPSTYKKKGKKQAK